MPKTICQNMHFPTNDVLADAICIVRDTLIHQTKRDFGPRLGFSWAPSRFKNGSTVVRGGAGIVYNRPDDVLFGNAAFNPPGYARTSICCGTSTADFGTPFANGQILYTLGNTRAYNSIQQTRRLRSELTQLPADCAEMRPAYPPMTSL